MPNYDEGLLERVRDVLGPRPDVKEKPMFSTRAFFVNGNMACGVRGEELYVRVGKPGYEQALGEPHARPFEAAEGRTMTGIVTVSTEGLATDEQLARWVDAGAEFAASLPPK